MWRLPGLDAWKVASQAAVMAEVNLCITSPVSGQSLTFGIGHCRMSSRLCYSGGQNYLSGFFGHNLKYYGC